jgi:restriction endonuclease S subunit
VNNLVGSKSLGDYVDFQNGYAFKSKEYRKSGHYLIRIKNVQQGYIERNDECYVDIPKEKKFENFLLRNGDIVISLTGNVGRVARIKDEHLPAALNQRVATITPKNNKELSFEYLYYLLRTPEFLDFARGSGKGAAQQNISTEDLKKYRVHIPTIDVQHKVVNQLDEAFVELDLLERNLKLSDEKADELLQTILDTSFSKQIGTVSTEGEQNPRNDAQFKSASIENLCCVEYGTRVVRKKDAGTVYPVYGGGGETFFLDTYNREDRVVIARFAMSVKCTRRVKGKFALNDSGLTLSPLDTKILSQDYLDYYVLSMNSEIYNSARGTAQKNLDVPAFRKMKISFPASLKKQQEIVAKLDFAFAEFDALKSQIFEKRNFAATLRQSLLSNAFSERGEVA